MGILGTFLKGAITGAVGLGVLSYFIANSGDDANHESETEENDQEEE